METIVNNLGVIGFGLFAYACVMYYVIKITTPTKSGWIKVSNASKNHQVG